MRAAIKNYNRFIAFQLCVLIIASTATWASPNNAIAAEKQQYVAVVPRHFPPHYVNNSNTQVSGFAIDVMNKVAELANIKIDYLVKDTWKDVDKALREGKADLIPNLGITSGRRTRFNFTLPVETHPVSIFVRSETEYIRGLNDLPGYSAAVVQYNIAEKILKEHPDIKLKSFEKAQGALFELLSGNVDALAYPVPVVLKMAKAIGVEDRIKIVGKPLTEIKRAMAVRKDHTVLLSELNKTLQAFLGSKEYQEIYLKWHAKPSPYWTTQRAMWVMGIVLAIVMIGMFGWRYFSILRINKRLIEETNVRKSAEKTLREREAHISLLMNSIAEAIYGVDIEGNCSFANPSCVSMLGYDSAEQLLGKNMSRLIYHADDPSNAASLNKIQRVYQEGIGIHVEHENVWRADGSVFPVECWAYPIIREQNIVGAVISFIDITERLQAQQELYNREQELFKYRDHLEDLVAERTQKLQVANEELEAFSYSVSHDLRAPLRSIDGFGLALAEDYSPKLDHNAKDYINRIRHSTKRMGQLIDDMLSLSKVSRHELKQEEVDLSALAGQALSQLIDGDPTRDINITIKDTPRVMGDPTLLLAVLDNLFSNTWKFTKNTKNPSVDFGSKKKDGEDVFYVHDNGIGFDMKYSGKLFGTFNRLHRQEDYEGTGIGLATVKRIINRHGGKVWAESDIGKGATFYFTVPVAKPKPQYKPTEKMAIH